MKVNQVIQAKVLLVTAKELNDDYQYNFKVYEFSNGLILVPGSTTNDWCFADRNEIEPCGTAVVTSIEETEEVEEWSSSDLLRSIQGSISEFGVDAVPSKHRELWSCR